MPDVMSPKKRSALMARIRGSNTKPELRIFAELDARGVGYDKHVRGLPGRPDVVFPKPAVVVFVEGDFWHGWHFPRWQHRLPAFWQVKIAANRARDRRNHRRLRGRGWIVVRIWEHDIEADVAKCVERILRVLGAKTRTALSA